MPTGIRSAGHVQPLYNLLKCFFIFLFFNKSRARWCNMAGGITQRRPETMHNQLPHFACHMLPVACCLLSVARPPADRNLDPQPTATATRSYPVWHKSASDLVLGLFAFLIHVSWLDRCLLCSVCSQLLFPLIIQLQLPDIGNNPIETTVVMLKHKLNVGYKTE